LEWHWKQRAATLKSCAFKDLPFPSRSWFECAAQTVPSCLPQLWHGLVLTSSRSFLLR
jgi:hypothetical protein